MQFGFGETDTSRFAYDNTKYHIVITFRIDLKIHSIVFLLLADDDDSYHPHK